MSVEVFHRYCSLDKKHEYSIVVPHSDKPYGNYWTYWLWYYLGRLSNGEHSNPRILPFANLWDEKCELIKTYKDTSSARRCANRIFNFIQKHYAKQKA